MGNICENSSIWFCSCITMTTYSPRAKTFNILIPCLIPPSMIIGSQLWTTCSTSMLYRFVIKNRYLCLFAFNCELTRNLHLHLCPIMDLTLYHLVKRHLPSKKNWQSPICIKNLHLCLSITHAITSLRIYVLGTFVFQITFVFNAKASTFEPSWCKTHMLDQ